MQSFEELKTFIDSHYNSNFHWEKLDVVTQKWIQGICLLIDNLHVDFNKHLEGHSKFKEPKHVMDHIRFKESGS